MAMTPSQRASIAGLTRWSQQDPVAGTAKARQSFLARFEHQVDPDGVLEPAERQRRAEAAKRAHFKRLGIRSGQSRARTAAEKAQRSAG